MTTEEMELAHECFLEAVQRCNTTLEDIQSTMTMEEVAQEWKFVLDIRMPHKSNHRTRRSWSVAYGGSYGLIAQCKQLVILGVGRSFKVSAWL